MLTGCAHVIDPPKGWDFQKCKLNPNPKARNKTKANPKSLKSTYLISEAESEAIHSLVPNSVLDGFDEFWLCGQKAFTVETSGDNIL